MFGAPLPADGVGAARVTAHFELHDAWLGLDARVGHAVGADVHARHGGVALLIARLRATHEHQPTGRVLHERQARVLEDAWR